MAQRYLHLITHAGLETHRVAAHALQREQLFAAGEEGVRAFGDWLAPHAADLHTLLVDVADEGFHLDHVPYTMGSDRRALIQRRLTQQFFGSPYATAISLGRERSGRRDERLLMTAITRPALVEPWLAALHSHEARLTALYTVPLLAGELIRKLAPGIPRGLILLLSGTGIRQIHFEEGNLRFSRLAPAPEGACGHWGLDCLREAQKTWQYLSAQRWIPRGASLPVVIVATDGDARTLLADIERTRQSDDKLQFRTATIDTLARQLGLAAEHSDSNSLPLLMQLAAREQGRGAQLASADDRRFFRLWQIQFAALWGCAAALTAAAVLSAHWLIDAHDNRQEARSLREEAVSYDQRYTGLIGSLPSMPTSVDALRAAVEGVERIRDGVTDPRAALLRVSKTMTQFPDVTLDKLSWQADPTKPRAQSLQISATLTHVEANAPRLTLARIQAFAAALGQGTGARTTVLQQPFDTGSDKLLRSDASLEGVRPAFVLQLDWDEVPS